MSKYYRESEFKFRAKMEGIRHRDKVGQVEITHSVREDGRTLCGRVVMWNTKTTSVIHPTCTTCRINLNLEKSWRLKDR